MERFYGNAQVQETLHQMLKRDRAAHGFLFYGEAGLGKKTLAKRFLAELLCTGAEKPCGVCKSCRMLRASGCALCGTQRKAWRILGGYGA